MDTKLRERLAVSLGGAAVALAVIDEQFQLVVLSVAKQKGGSVVELILGPESSEKVNSEGFGLGVE
jgi:hypothetical protein